MQLTQHSCIMKKSPATSGSGLVRGVAATGGVRFAGLALAFVTNLVLARLLGVEEYGMLVFVLTWVGLLSVVGIFGMDRLLVREVANYRMQASWGHLRGLLRWACTVTASICAAIILIGICLSFGKLTRMHLPAAYMLITASSLLLFTVMMRVSAAVLQGFHRTARSQLAELLIQPGLCIVLVATFAVALHGRLMAQQALALNAVAAGLGCACAGWLLWRAWSACVRPMPVQYASKVWLLGVLPLFLVNVLGVVSSQISSLLVGAISGVEALGVFSVADRGAQLVVFPLAVVNLTLAPVFAILFRGGDMVSLQRLVTKSARLVLISAAAIALALILGRHWFLQIFGHGFAAGQSALVILCAGQLVSAAMGSVGTLLAMTGYGREVAVGVGIGAAANLGLSVLLIPSWGADGAAVAVASSLIIWNVLLAVIVWKRLGIATTALGRIGGRIT